MKKRMLALTLALLCLMLCACGEDVPIQTTPAFSTQPTTPETTPAQIPTTPPQAVQNGDVKAIWLSQFDLSPIYLEGGGQRSQEDFTAKMETVLNNVVSSGFNTVFLQIRPNGDSMYPSEFYPQSAYVTGALGKEAEYDPVAIIVELAHDRNLSIHAWINPMRGMNEEEILLVSREFSIRRWYNSDSVRGKYIVLVEGKWYLNPAYKEVSDLIVSGAEEALTRYDFDGLHMDDYFYPTTDPSFDAIAYNAFGGGKTLADFRRGNLNLLVKRLYEMTHSLDGNLVFGISPAGNAERVYNEQYADIDTWCARSGYIDYICPQVYFGLEHGSFDFQKVCNTYSQMIKAGDVQLIIGMTFGKALSGEDKWAGDGKYEWTEHKDVLKRSLETTKRLPHCRGVSVFCYQYLFDPLTGAPIPETAQERENFIPLLKSISWK